MKKFLSVILAIVLIISTIPLVAVAATESNTVVLYTNDVHCAIEDYAVLAAYRAELIADGHTVITVDAGDAIQGEVIGMLTQGEAIVDIMNTVGYDYAVPGNHEYDYGMKTFLDLAENKADYEYISSNFYDLRTLEPVLAPYAIEDLGDYQIAFVGISTPETITKSTPEFFKDANGIFVYGFPKYPGGMTNEALYDNIQESVDNAIDDGADIVVAVGHLGIQETTDGWKSTDVIENTNGIDYFIDSHSHETFEADTYKNKDNEDVVLSSTGTKFANFGQLTISADGSGEFELINPDEVNVETMSAEAKSAYNTVKDKVDGYNDEIAYLYEVIGTSYANLVAYDEDGTWAVRKRETNAGDFVADAYREVTGADIAICNGGGVRAEIAVGDVTRKMLMDINAFNNDMCVIEVTGQQLIDVLEHGARECPESLGSFFQVSGVTFELHTWRESPVITDQLDNFMGLDETKERRVTNVYVGGEPVELDKTYTLAGSTYVLMQGGDGLTMLDGATVVQYEDLPCDSEMLIEYLEILGGKITAEKYGNPDGDGRIKIIDADPDADAFEYDYEISYGETITVSAPNYNSGEFVYIKFVPEDSGNYIFKSASDPEISDPACILYDSNFEQIESSDDVNGYDFFLVCYLEKGETYYFEVFNYNEDVVCSLTLSRAIHTNDDGTEHELEFVKETYSTCTEHGYTAGLYCPECDEYVSGHEEKELEDVHNDDNDDDICDDCGLNFYGALCQHLCHSDSFFTRIIWAIVNFFSRLFRISPICECGVAHY